MRALMQQYGELSQGIHRLGQLVLEQLISFKGYLEM